MSLFESVQELAKDLGLPPARLEKDWYRLGLVLSRNDMANWIIRCSQECLEPVYGRILENLREHCEVRHMKGSRRPSSIT